VLMHDNTYSCHIGLLLHHLAGKPQEAAYLSSKFAQILELYDENPIHARSIKHH
jgi:hypothetical protein